MPKNSLANTKDAHETGVLKIENGIFTDLHEKFTGKSTILGAENWTGRKKNHTKMSET